MPIRRKIYGSQHPQISYITVVGKQIASFLTLCLPTVKENWNKSQVRIVLLLKCLPYLTDKTIFMDHLKIILCSALLHDIYAHTYIYINMCVYIIYHFYLSLNSREILVQSR